MRLPGMEAEQDAVVRHASAAKEEVQIACPNCGWTEFNEDGDCTRCWEPDVVRKSLRRRRG
jgi:RNase P subunit RPR2